jgi:hypothetical protein
MFLFRPLRQEEYPRFSTAQKISVCKCSGFASDFIERSSKLFVR